MCAKIQKSYETFCLVCQVTELMLVDVVPLCLYCRILVISKGLLRYVIDTVDGQQMHA